MQRWSTHEGSKALFANEPGPAIFIIKDYQQYQSTDLHSSHPSRGTKGMEEKDRLCASGGHWGEPATCAEAWADSPWGPCHLPRSQGDSQALKASSEVSLQGRNGLLLFGRQGKGIRNWKFARQSVPGALKQQEDTETWETERAQGKTRTRATCVVCARAPHPCRMRRLVRPARERAPDFAGQPPPARARVLSVTRRSGSGGGTLGTRRRGAGLPGRGQGGGESRGRPETRRVFPAPGSGRCALHLADFLHPGPRVHRLTSVVTPSPEGCLAFRPRPEAARGVVGVQAGPREPEVTTGCGCTQTSARVGRC